MKFEAQPASDAVGIPLNELRLPRGSVIAALVHEGEVTIPRGNTVIEQGDHVVVWRSNPRFMRWSVYCNAVWSETGS